jgi:diguanylate cyclase (GGDEF)-like protein/PAS domain S-box-containing protein
MDDRSKDERIRLLEQTLQVLRTELVECREHARQIGYHLGLRAKRLYCLYEVASLSHAPARPVAQAMQAVLNSLVSAYQHPDVTCARITFEGHAYCSQGFRDTRWRQAADLAFENQTVGTVEVFYREERPAAQEGPFLKEERELISSVATLLAQYLRSRSEREVLNQREREFRTLAENSTDTITRFTRELRIIYANPAIEAFIGHPSNFVLGKTNRELGMPEALADYWGSRLRQVFATGKTQTIEAALPTAKGERTFESRVIPERGPDGSVETLLAITRDITEHKRLEQRLRESEARCREDMSELESLYQRAPIGIALLDTQLRYRRVNAWLAEMNGIPAEMHIGKTIHEVVPAIADAAMHIGQQVIETGEPALNVEFRGEAPAKPGTERFWREHWLPLKDPGGSVWGIIAVVEDITEPKRAEQALRESERKYRTLVDNLYEGIWLIDQDEKTTFVNSRMAELLGYQAEEMLGKNLLVFMDAQAAESAALNLARGRSGERAEYDFVFRRKNGEPICTHITTAPIYDEQGRYRGALAGVIDITARKQAEEALYRRQQEFEALAERAPDIIARIDRAWRMTYINPAVERVTHRPREWFLGKTLEEWGLTPRETALRTRLLQEAFDNGTEQAVEHEYHAPTGVQYFHSRLVPEFGPDGKVVSVLVIDRDITELKQAHFALERMSLEDPLTETANRRYLDHFIGREWGREVRHQHPVAVIMADIDHFKAYNDRYGHQRGDDCLLQVAQALKSHLRRPSDVLVRYGGEEFVVILLETDLSAATQLAETMHKAIAQRAVPHEASSVAPIVTVSLGVAAAPAHLTTFPDLLSAADEALYRAKRKGRNRVEVGHPKLVRAF